MKHIQVDCQVSDYLRILGSLPALALSMTMMTRMRNIVIYYGDAVPRDTGVSASPSPYLS